MDNNSNKIKQILEKIVNNVQTIVNNGEYEKFLKFQKNFRNYSFNNLALIYDQFPMATKVAGKSTWIKLKREVLKDARKIWIVAPIPRKYDKKVKKIINGEEVEKTETIQYNTYRYVYVYDISQTVGEEIPLSMHYMNSEEMDYFYEKLKRLSHLPIFEEKLTGGTKGYYSEKGQRIVIENTLSANDKAAVLLHELSHALYDDFDYKTDRGLSEVFVESIAYIVADHFGLDTSLCSFNYITQWANGNPKVVISLGSKIQKCANEFIDKIENFKVQELELVA